MVLGQWRLLVGSVQLPLMLWYSHFLPKVMRLPSLLLDTSSFGFLSSCSFKCLQERK